MELDPSKWLVKHVYMFIDLFLKQRNKEKPLLQELMLTLGRTRAVLKEINPDLTLLVAIEVEKEVLVDVLEDLWCCLRYVFEESMDSHTATRLGVSDIILTSCSEIYFENSIPLIVFWAFLYTHLIKAKGHFDPVGAGKHPLKQTVEDIRKQQAIHKVIEGALDLGQIPTGLDLDVLGEVGPAKGQEDDGVLGEGAEGKVYKRVWRGEEVAVKEVSMASVQELVSSITWGSCSSKVEDFSLDRELRILQRLRHPNVVELKGVTRKVEAPGKYGLVMELMQMTLADLISNAVEHSSGIIKQGEPPRTPLGDLVTIDILLQVARGMRFLHSSDVMHRDLKTSNVLIDSPPHVPSEALSLPYVSVKLADFGLAMPGACSPFEAGGQSGFKGTTFYMAPEVRASEPRYTTKADVFSFGTICFCLATGTPQPVKTASLFYKKIKSGRLGDLLSACPKYLASLLERCWLDDPENRPDFSFICESLLSLKWRALLKKPKQKKLIAGETDRRRGQKKRIAGGLRTGRRAQDRPPWENYVQNLPLGQSVRYYATNNWWRLPQGFVVVVNDDVGGVLMQVCLDDSTEKVWRAILAMQEEEEEEERSIIISVLKFVG